MTAKNFYVNTTEGEIQVGKTTIPTDGTILIFREKTDGYHLAFGSSVKTKERAVVEKGGDNNTTQTNRRGHCHDVLNLTLEDFSSDIVVENNSNGYVFSSE